MEKWKPDGETIIDDFSVLLVKLSLISTSEEDRIFIDSSKYCKWTYDNPTITQHGDNYGK